MTGFVCITYLHPSYLGDKKTSFHIIYTSAPVCQDPRYASLLTSSYVRGSNNIKIF